MTRPIPLAVVPDPSVQPRRIAALTMLLATAIAGCRNSDSLPVLTVHEVKGKVLLADGTPLNGGWIYFVPRATDLSVTPSGEIRPDGTFTLVTGGSGEGAPAGEYKVRVDAPQYQQVPPKSRKKPVIPLKYGDEDSSGLVVVVKEQSNQLEPIRLR